MEKLRKGYEIFYRNISTKNVMRMEKPPAINL